MKRIGLNGGWAIASMVLLAYVVVVRLHFLPLPAAFLALGLATTAWNARKGLSLFLFLLPLISATPDFFFNGYPYNYMAIPLFYLAGMIPGALLKGERPVLDFPGRGYYLLFLSLLGISVGFVFLRWSNLGLPSLALLRDTPVSPSLDRLSFACIFPLLTLALFSLPPYLAALIRSLNLGEREIFVPLKAGFILSFLLALFQRWIDREFMAQGWWISSKGQPNGGFSDFNAFGFFAGALFLAQALELIELTSGRKKIAGGDRGGTGPGAGGMPQAKSAWPGLLFLTVALAAIFLSGCRTAFIFVLAAAIALVFSRKVGLVVKAAAALLLAGSLFIAGGTLGHRLQQTAARAARLSSAADLFQAADKVSNGRLEMLRDGARMMARFPVSGIGGGNFLFYLKYLRFGESAYLDLPLNQYLLFFCETGLAGGLAFVFFLAALWRRQKKGRGRRLLAVMAFALLFNNFFWFPEVVLLFWIFAAGLDWGAAPPLKSARAWGAGVALLFSVMNVMAFMPLHPLTWARRTATAYDYGFSYRERDGGRSFRWTGEQAGFYLHLDRRLGAEFRLVCGAPLGRLAGRRQVVDVYWRGKPYRRAVFERNGEFVFRLDDASHDQGFLEFRVRPVFNLMRMGLGSESRDLGIQVSGAGI